MTMWKGSTGFRVLDDAIRLRALIRPIVAAAKAAGDRELADQLRRASRSVVANTSEGRNRRGRHQASFFDTAYGSSQETKVWLTEAVADGVVAVEVAEAAYDLADKCAATLWKLKSA